MRRVVMHCALCNFFGHDNCDIKFHIVPSLAENTYCRQDYKAEDDPESRPCRKLHILFVVCSALFQQPNEVNWIHPKHTSQGQVLAKKRYRQVKGDH